MKSPRHKIGLFLFASALLVFILVLGQTPPNNGPLKIELPKTQANLDVIPAVKRNVASPNVGDSPNQVPDQIVQSLPPGRASKSDPSLDERNLLPLVRGSRLWVNGHNHRSLAADAVPADLYRNEMGPPLYKQNGFVLVKSLANGGSPRYSSLRRPTFLGAHQDRVEIVSGTIIVELKNPSRSPEVAQKFRLTELSTDPSINRVYYRLPEGFKFGSDLTKLGGDACVLGVEVELLRGRLELR